MEGNGGRMSRGEQMCLCVGVSTCAKLAWAEREKRSIEKREVLSVGIGVVWEVVAVLHSKETSQVNFPNLLQGFSVIVDLPYFWHGSVHTKLACDARGIYQLVSKKRGCRQPFSPALLKQTPSSNKHYTLQHSLPKQRKASNPPNNCTLYNSRYNEHGPARRHGQPRRRDWHKYVKS